MRKLGECDNGDVWDAINGVSTKIYYGLGVDKPDKDIAESFEFLGSDAEYLGEFGFGPGFALAHVNEWSVGENDVRRHSI